MALMRGAATREAVATIARRLQDEADAQHAGLGECGVPSGESAALSAKTAAPQ